MNEDDKNLLISKLDDIRKSIFQRSLAIVVVVVLAAALLQSENADHREKYAMIEISGKLEAMKGLSKDSVEQASWDLRMQYDGPMRKINRNEYLYDKLEYGDFSDTITLNEAIALLDVEIKKMKEASPKTIPYLGAILEADVWKAVVPIILFVLFHNLANLFSYRRKLFDLAQQNEIQSWKIGQHFLGFGGVRGYEQSNVYLGLISEIIMFGFLLLPVVISSYCINSTEDIGATVWQRDLLNGFALGVFIVTLIDFFVILYYENILKLRSLINLYLAPNITKPTTKPSFNHKLFWWLTALLPIAYTTMTIVFLFLDLESIIYLVFMFGICSIFPLSIIGYNKFQYQIFVILAFSSLIMILSWIDYGGRLFDKYYYDIDTNLYSNIGTRIFMFLIAFAFTFVFWLLTRFSGKETKEAEGTKGVESN